MTVDVGTYGVGSPANTRHFSIKAPVLRRPRPGTATFLALAVVGWAIRLILLRTTWLQPDSDEATGMVMAERAAHGHLSLVFWGGDYGGTLVTWVEAPLIRVFGLHLLMFWLVDTGLAFAAAILLWLLARQVLPDVAAAAVAGTSWFFPTVWVFWSSREYVYWLSAIVLAEAACWAALRWRRHPSPAGLALAGLLAGAAVWSYPLVVALLGPAMAGLVWAVRRRPTSLALLSASAGVGVSPWLAYFAVHGSKAIQVQPAAGSRLAALRHTLTQVLPTALVGGQHRVSALWALTTLSQPWLDALGAVLYGLGGLCLLVSAAKRRWPIALAASSVVVWPFVLLAGHVPVSPPAYRYAFAIMPALLFLAGWALSRLRCSLLLPAVAVLSTVLIGWPSTNGFASAPGCSSSLTSAGRFLSDHGRHASWGSYWLASALTVCSPPGVTVAAPAPIRDVAAAAAARSAAYSTFVVFAGGANDARITSWTTSHPGPSSRSVVGDGDIAIWMFPFRLDPHAIGVTGTI